ncbi:hypothetical protein LSAT2_013622 [Lamellibrachia satsuma]|nr:hypothetical protein LSAT2_013622 [Lamellibrachia satsuma]
MKVGYRLSPNEELQLLQAERERRRKVRLLQVREQAKLNAAYVRNAVKEEKSKQLNKLAQKLKEELEGERQERMKELSDLYVKTARGSGEGPQGGRG